MIIDAHYHLEPALETPQRLLSEMDRLDIRRTVLIANLCEPFRMGPVAHAASTLMRRSLRSRRPAAGRFLYRTTVTSKGRFSILGKTYAIFPRPDNEAVAALLAAHPDRFWGWYFVNPAADPPVPVDPAALDLGPEWVGLKAHPFWHRCPVRLLDEVARFCAETGRPLLVHLGADPSEGGTGDFRYLPRRHPHLRLIYAHAAVPHYQAVWDFMRGPRGRNVFVDLSSPYLDEALRRATVAALSPARCLYGSDGPYGYPDAEGRYDRSAILGEIQRLDLGAADRDRILGGNLLSLLDRDGGDAARAAQL